MTKPPDPAWLAWARNEIGTKEQEGPGDNSRVLAYWEIGKVKKPMPFTGDEVSWCAAFANAALEAARIRGSSDGKSPKMNSPLARSFSNWGQKAPSSKDGPPLGCIIVLNRPGGEDWQGHVGFCTGWTHTHIRLLGGNQSDQVNEAWFDRRRIVAQRWPHDVPFADPAPVVLNVPKSPDPKDR